MAASPAALLTEQEIISRNLELLQVHTAAILADPDLGGDLPEGATLVLIPEADLFMAGYNLALARQRACAGEVVYLVEMTDGGRPSRPLPLAAAH